VDEKTHAVLWLALLIVLSFLMVSTFRYTSFKKVDLKSRRSYVTVVGIVLLFVVVMMHPSGASSPWPRCSGSRDRSPTSGDSCSAAAPARPRRRAQRGALTAPGPSRTRPDRPYVGVGGVVLIEGAWC
jgi:hypothetical protein